jgi:hypothetical protein
LIRSPNRQLGSSQQTIPTPNGCINPAIANMGAYEKCCTTQAVP